VALAAGPIYDSAAVTEGTNRVQEGALTPVVPDGTGGIFEQARSIGQLPPVAKRWPWITGGLVLQLIGVAGPVIYVLEKVKKEGLGGHITRATIRLIWHQSVHSHAGLAVMIGGAVVFAIGAMLLARPFVKHVVTLLVAIPIAAVAGLFVLGAAALVVTLIVVVAGALDSDFSFGGGGGGSGSGSSGSSGGSGGSSSSGGSSGDVLSGPDYGSFYPSHSRKKNEEEQESPSG
jgi:hypothetical protein